MANHPITIHIADEPFTGVWRISRNQLLVASALGDIRMTLRGSHADPDALARWLLRELVRDRIGGAQEHAG